MDFKELMAAVSQSMLAEYRVVSAQFSHRGLRGGERENTLKSFLSGYLPPTCEIVSGEIFDINGSHSPESDIIVIDTQSVPRLSYGDKRLVPAEGVYSVIESKSKLDSAQMLDCVEKCIKIKSLEKSAYLEPKGLVRYLNVYGEDQMVFPILFTVFSYSAIEPRILMNVMADRMNGCQPISGFIDSVVCLEDGWIMCWLDREHDKMELVAAPNRVPGYIRTGEDTLMVFYMLYYKWIAQAWCPPINLTRYLNKYKLEFPTGYY